MSPADRLPGDNSAAGRRARTAHALTEARRRRLFAQLSRPRSSFAIIGWAREGDGADRFAETEQSAPGSAGARMNAVGPFAATDRGALLNLAGGHSGGCAFAIGLSLFADRVLTIVTFAAAGSAPRKSNIPPLEGRARTVASRNSNYRDRSRRVCQPHSAPTPSARETKIHEENFDGPFFIAANFSWNRNYFLALQHASSPTHVAQSASFELTASIVPLASCTQSIIFDSSACRYCSTLQSPRNLRACHQPPIQSTQSS